MTEQSLPCPNCGNKITFDVNALLSGASFACPNCETKISLSQDSRQTTQASLNKFEKLKNNKSSNESS